MLPSDQRPISRTQIWVGRVLSALPALFFIADAVGKLFRPPQVIEATTKLGYSESVLIPLGVVLLSCTILYLIPRTAILGAILLTGYLGGAVATHVRVGAPLFTDMFPAFFGLLLWAGLFLRNRRLQDLILSPNS